MRVLELFSGYGSQALALENLGIEFVSDISEIDKYAIQAYNQLHGETHNWGDITKIQKLNYADLWTYSFPCQDLSVAGKQAGISDGTRSGLLLHVERLLETAVLMGNQPKYLLLENVKGLVSKKFKPDFDRWLQKLYSLGYNNYWQVLNAKDYGVPQNRERVFVGSIRKDIDNKGYKFPEKIPLTRKLKDILEPVVDENYYLSADKVEKLIARIKEKEVSNTIRCGGGGSLDGKHTWDIVLIGEEQKHQSVKRDSISTCLCASMGKGGGLEPKILEEGVGLNLLSRKLEFNGFKENCPSLRATDYKYPHCYSDGYRIRKLTPRECWRLMGVKDEQFDKLHDISNTQLYKLAGNSIVVDVLEAIFRNLFSLERKEKEK